jgi:hypothetical protein
MIQLRYVSIALLAAACGGGQKSGVQNTGGTPPATTTLAPGSSNFPGLDWGDNAEAIAAKYPDAKVNGDTVEVHTQFGGHDATATLMLAGGSLVSIDVSFAGTFPSMGECEAPFKEVRADLDKSLGQSQYENLAAFWADGSVELSCNTDDSGTVASMMLTYSLPEGEEGE